MAEVLELAHLRQRHRVTQMQIGSGRIDSEFHPERPIFSQFLEQLLFANELRPPLFNVFDDGLRVHCSQFSVDGPPFFVRIPPIDQKPRTVNCELRTVNRERFVDIRSSLNILPDSRRSRIRFYEKNLSTFQAHPEASAWFSGSDENKGRPCDAGPAPSTGPETLAPGRHGQPLRSAHPGLR